MLAHCCRPYGRNSESWLPVKTGDDPASDDIAELDGQRENSFIAREETAAIAAALHLSFVKFQQRLAPAQEEA